jgi:hypothetical protein
MSNSQYLKADHKKERKQCMALSPELTNSTFDIGRLAVGVIKLNYD